MAAARKPKFVSRKDAAEWLGIGLDMLEEFHGIHPWLKKKHVKTRVLYAWADIECLGDMIERGISGLEPPKKEDSGKKP